MFEDQSVNVLHEDLTLFEEIVRRPEFAQTPIFLLLVMAVFELGFMIFTQSVLDDAARSAARLIRTGQVQSGGGQQAFQTMLCNSVSSIIGCDSIIYQSQQFPSWSAAQTAVNQPPQRDENGNLITSGFTAGSGGEIIVVQVTYSHRFFTLLVGERLGSGTNSAFLMSTVAFQNEPF